jgi:hypothetical protein
MVIWSTEDESRQRAATLRATPADSPEVLANAKSWGFGHGVRQPRLTFPSLTPR